MHAPRKPDHDQSSDRSRSLVRPAPARVTAKPDAPAGPGGSMTPGQALALQRSVGNAAASRAIEQEQHVHGADCGHAPPVQRSAVHDVLDTPGQPFTGPLRTEMEARFGGADFSAVRLHTDSAAQKSATEIGARAYTSGNHVVFGPGPVEPKVVAHELRHTQQQAAGPVAGTDHGDGLSMSDKSDDFEKEAEAFSEQVMEGPPPESVRAPEPSAGPAPEPAVQRMAVGRAAPVAVQRVGESSASAAAGQPAEGAQDVKGKAVIYRLSRSIESRAVESKLKVNVWAPGTWYPEKLMLEGKMRLRRTLDRRVLAGEVFTAQDLADIEALTTVNPTWLKDVGIGTIEEAKAYTTKGNYKDWLNLPAGKRVLTATLAYNNHLKGAPIPDAPDYTLGRFFTTQGSTLTDEQKQPLKDERDEQIRQTAVRTLHPAAIPPQDMHADANKAHVTQHQEKADKARDVFTNVLLVLQHGLKIYDKEQKQHIDYSDGDVVRALAHGGRVNIRIPALSDGESASSLTHFLGVTDDKGTPAQFVEERPFATHGMDIEKNKKDGRRGKFEETSGGLVSLGNRIKPGGPDMLGLDIPGGGIGSKDWNGDVVLPTGSHGHMLLVFTAPTKEKDGSLLVGIETIGPHKPSPVGYKHDFRATEATSNPESVLHGHKRDKIGSGGTAKNERYVDLKEMGRAQGGGDWRGFLDDIKQGWYAELNKTKDGSDERQKLYQQLVGPRQHFYDET